MMRLTFAEKGTFCTLHEATDKFYLNNKGDSQDVAARENQVTTNIFSSIGKKILRNMINDGATLEEVQVQFKCSYARAQRAVKEILGKVNYYDYAQ